MVRSLQVRIVSFRLGWEDGVSVEATKWARVLRELGHEVTTVAGHGRADVLVPGLDFTDDVTPDPAAVQHALAPADLVVVSNLLSLPLKPSSSSAVAAALRGRPALLCHYDVPWQRERFAHVTGFPPDDPAWRHVTVNELTRRQLAERGIAAVTIPNAFDPPARAGRREALRAALDVAPDEILALQPTRAIARKGIDTALAFAEELGATLWITGPTEEGFDAELARMIGGARCRVIRRWPTKAAPSPGTGPSEWDMADAYAAGDLVTFPSRWEGFGNPVIEAALYRRPLVVRMYAVAQELAAFGFRWFDVDDPSTVATVRAFLAAPDAALLDHNAAVARTHFSIAALRDRLAALLAEPGWLPTRTAR